MSRRFCYSVGIGVFKLMIYRKYQGRIFTLVVGLLIVVAQAQANLFLDLLNGNAWQSNRDISRNIKQFLNTGEIDDPDHFSQRLNTLRTFYSARKYAPVWCESGGPNSNAETLLTALNSSDREGLNPANYLPSSYRWHCNLSDPKEKARADLLLTDAFLRYSGELFSGGLDPRQADRSWHLDPPVLDPVELLQTTLQDGEFGDNLHRLSPPHPGYEGLRSALQKYVEFLKAGDWPMIPAGPLLKPGDHHDSLPVVRERLAREGDYTPHAVSDQEFFDPSLEEAIKRFQYRHGLKVDGTLGPETRSALNVSLPTRIEQIQLNMERWRWMPREMEQRYLLVNTAAFELQLIEDQRTRLRMRVINGRRDRTTPVFKSQVTNVVFNPFWTVPYRIAVKDLLPKQQKDPGYFSHMQIDVFQRINGEQVLVDPGSIDWTQYSQSYFPFLLRQQPGPHNALGRLKFLSPNRFDIYLHDTPNHSLFDKHIRTFSSGCIRLEDPKRLAALLLETEETSILEKINDNETMREPLSSKLPLYVVYLTAWMDEKGVVHFRNDIYGRDQLLAEQKQRAAWEINGSRLESAATINN